MNLLVLGTGGREHALAYKLAQDDKVKTVFVATGNAGTKSEPKLQNVALDIKDHKAVATFCQNNGIEFVLVGAEAPLVAGIVDDLQKENIKVWGCSQYCSQLEGSKAFAKDFMVKHAIPTAFYEVFSEVAPAKDFVKQQGTPIVIKADGLAAGKGVIVAMNEAEAFGAIDDMLSGNKFGQAGSRVVIEEFLAGEEASFICMIDGKNILPMATSQDHKRIFEGDKGDNTGGMGAYSPAPVVTDEVHQKVMNQIIRPVVQAMADNGTPYTGFLYAGLMIDKDSNPKVIEFNCRFGDPETQPIMMRLKSSLVDLIMLGLDGNLPSVAEWDDRPALGIVLAGRDYPQGSNKGDVITGLGETDDVKIFHAGTAVNDKGEIITSGGRIVCVTALGESIKDAQTKALAVCEQVQFDGKQYRRDIGWRAIGR
ncbi:phosphoribosylamine--glycine ligase [Moraxella oblonga]|uniref:phosphoribosylamine--glycine ligase n=1 Tax=Moraxella oblonga TaxID=200413 RepID=UPI0008347AB5|nr:phosphoribosylamine--glycine ligase [Moraxella oblonga]